MYLIVGLGNPEGEYSNTRHNMGFDAINHLSQKINITVTKEKFKALYGDGMINIIVIYDDIDVDVGKIKIRKKGGPGTHNGMKSVVEELQTEDFPRIRVGIGKPMFKEMMIGYVLQKLQGEERDILNDSTKKAADAVCDIITYGIDKAMNMYN